MQVYPAVPARFDRYELVRCKGEHSAFTDRVLPGARDACYPSRHRVILAVTTAHWDTYVLADTAARFGCTEAEPARCWSQTTASSGKRQMYLSRETHMAEFAILDADSPDWVASEVQHPHQGRRP